MLVFVYIRDWTLIILGLCVCKKDSYFHYYYFVPLFSIRIRQAGIAGNCIEESTSCHNLIMNCLNF